MTFRSIALAGLIATVSGTAAFAAGHAVAPAVENDGILVDANGMSLYTFDKDADGASNCNGGCAVKWPPLLADSKDSDSEGFTVITRKDGSLQWAYNDEPLYLWINDKAPGDVTGDGVGGVWHLARP